MGLIGRREAARIQFITPAMQKRKDYQKRVFSGWEKKDNQKRDFSGWKKKDDQKHGDSSWKKKDYQKRGSTGARARAASREILLKSVHKTATPTLKIQNLAYPITCDPIWRAASRRLNKVSMSGAILYLILF